MTVYNYIYSMLCCCILIGFLSCSETIKKDTSKPNIIVFMVDDMGWQDTSVPFWKEKTVFKMDKT